MEDTLVPLGLFLMMGTVISLIVYFRFRSRRELQMTIRGAIDAGQSLSPQALEDLMAAMQPKKSDLRRGLIWTAIALGLVVCSVVIDEPDARALTGVAAFPFFIGVAYLILWRLGSDK